MADIYWAPGYWPAGYWARGYWPSTVDPEIIGQTVIDINPFAGLAFNTSIRGRVSIVIKATAGMIFRVPGQQAAMNRRRRTHRNLEG